MENSLEHIALNQTLFGKAMIIGQGFQEGKQSSADSTLNKGWYVFVNGRTEMPKSNNTINRLYTIGTMYYENLLSGMGQQGGYVRYQLGITDDEFLIFAGVKLDEELDDYTDDVAVFMFKNRMSPGNENISIQDLSKELLSSHFSIFLGTNNPRAIFEDIEIDSEWENSILKEALIEYLELIESKKISTKESSAEIEDIVKEMNRLNDEN